MKTIELRVGNYYYDCSTDEIEIITGKTFLQIFTGKLSCMKPIPLTEEWLLKFGFVKYKLGHDTYKLKKFIIEAGLFKKTPYCFRMKIDKENSLALSEIKYVHSLQNLFFALTGEELIIKSE